LISLLRVAALAAAQNNSENEMVIEIHRAMGADFRNQWRPILLSGEALQRLAEKAL